MREIKFRAWDGGKMIPLSLYQCIHRKEDLVLRDPSIDEGWIDDETTEPKWPIMAYTGLKDKNGREVYEGDIIAVNHEGNDGLGIIRWCDAGACFTVDWPPVTLYDLQIDRYYEVVGNTYENQELLGKS